MTDRFTSAAQVITKECLHGAEWQFATSCCSVQMIHLHVQSPQTMLPGLGMSSIEMEWTIN